MDNGYIALWGGKQIEVFAETTYSAQQKATIEFQKGTRKKVKGYEITVILCEKDEKQVYHSTGGL